MPVEWDFDSVSLVGEREKNEDYCMVVSGPAGLCAILCDGLGGHVGGELASKCVCESIQNKFMEATSDQTPEELVAFCDTMLTDHIRGAELRLRERREERTP